jgi:hypothetical protein
VGYGVDELCARRHPFARLQEPADSIGETCRTKTRTRNPEELLMGDIEKAPEPLNDLVALRCKQGRGTAKDIPSLLAAIEFHEQEANKLADALIKAAKIQKKYRQFVVAKTQQAGGKLTAELHYLAMVQKGTEIEMHETKTDITCNLKAPGGIVVAQEVPKGWFCWRQQNFCGGEWGEMKSKNRSSAPAAPASENDEIETKKDLSPVVDTPAALVQPIGLPEVTPVTETMVHPTPAVRIRQTSAAKRCPKCGFDAFVTGTRVHPAVIPQRVRYYRCGNEKCGQSFKG